MKVKSVRVFKCTLLIFALMFFVHAGCTEQKPSDNGREATPSKEEGPLVVYTTFYPTSFFAAALGGEHVKVVNPVPPDEDPIFWVPPPEVIKAYQEEADLIVLNGGGFAKWVDTVMLPEGKVINAGAAFEDELIQYEDAVTHSHGPRGSHAHTGIDAHTWLDPVNAMAQCRAIAQALTEKDPDHKSVFDENLAKLLESLEGLNQAFEKLTAKYDGKPILASHPAYNYLARRHGWSVKSFAFDPEEEPMDEDVAAFAAFMAEHPACRHMIWESQPAPEIERLFKERFQVESLVFSPVENPPPEGVDYLSAMQRNIENIERIFE